MSISKKSVFNPFTKKLQYVLNENEISEKNHVHSIQSIAGLESVLYNLSKGNPISIQGGYFAN